MNSENSFVWLDPGSFCSLKIKEIKLEGQVSILSQV